MLISASITDEDASGSSMEPKNLSKNVTKNSGLSLDKGDSDFPALDEGIANNSLKKRTVEAYDSVNELKKSRIVDDKSSINMNRKKVSFDMKTSKRNNSNVTQIDRTKLFETLGRKYGKPNWKEVKKLSLNLKETRKKKKLTDYERIVEAKKLWGVGRSENCSVEKRAKIIVSLYELLENRFSVVVFQHDTSRIVQWLLKFGTPTVRLSITQSLRSSLTSMLQKKFSRFCVKNVFKYGSNECRRIAFRELRGKIVKLMSSSLSAPIVEYVFSRWSSPEDKVEFQNEFYGLSLKVVTDKLAKCLQDALAETHLKENILKDTKANICQVIAKRVPVSSLTHSIILDFLNHCSSEDRGEILDFLYPHVIDLLQSREGGEVAMRCCWFVSQNVKKSIMKSLVGHIVDVCLMPYGFWFIMALFDSVDDMVALKKYVLTELLTNVFKLLPHENGRKVICYLVAHRDTTYFHPELISLLKTSDSSEFVKKDADIKRTEILNIVVEPLANLISNDLTPWFASPPVALVIMAIMKVGKGDARMLNGFQSLAHYICDNPVFQVNNKSVVLVEHSSFHFVIKKIIKNEHGEQGIATLSYQLACELSENVIHKWIKINRGCFVLTYILETKNEKTVQILSSKLTDDMRKFIEDSKYSGSIELNKLLSNVAH